MELQVKQGSYFYLNTNYLSTMRLDIQEREALRYALQDFRGLVYLFGSRLNNTQRGGDIDILLIPNKKTNSLKLSLAIQKNFFSRCEEQIDVVVYDGSLFCTLLCPIFIFFIWHQ